ncbi:MAG: glycosyltransferase [candidate division WOR-3 bacterium]
MDEKKFELNLIVVLFKRKNAEQFFTHNYKILKEDNIKLILIDNGDNENVIPKDLKKVYIKNPENYGYGKSINIGSSFVETDYFLISNDDIIFEKEYFKKLEHKIKEYREKSYSIVGFNIYSNISFRKGIQKKCYDPFVILYHFSFLPFILSLFDRKSNGYLGVWEGIHFYKGSKEVCGVNGSLMLIEKKSFERVGKFDPGFFLTYEETDLFLRFKKQNFKIFYESKLKAFHKHNLSASKESLNYSFKSMDYFLEKHYGKKVRRFINIYLKLFLFLKRMLQLKR